MEDLETRRTSAPVGMDDCGLVAASNLVGDRWKLLILREILYGVRRFADIQADIDIPRSVLSSRLANLVESGILARVEYREGKQRARREYTLTEKGRDLMLPLAALWQWGRKYSKDRRTDLVLRQGTTGDEISVGFAPKERLVPVNDVFLEF